MFRCACPVVTKKALPTLLHEKLGLMHSACMFRHACRSALWLYPVACQPYHMRRKQHTVPHSMQGYNGTNGLNGINGTMGEHCLPNIIS